MKKIILFLLILSFSVSIFALNNKPNDKWFNSLKPKGQEIKFSLDNVSVIVPANPTKKEIKAYEDLSFYLDKMTGKHIPVVKDTEFIGGRFISVGNTGLFRMSSFDHTKLDPEGYGIKGDEKGLYLFGGERRGPMYAVYSLLEEDNGFRFWSADTNEDYIPKSDTLTFVPREINPDFETRDPYISQARNTEFALKNKISTINIIPEELGGGFESWSGLAHTTFNFVFPHEFETQPEWFKMADGKREPTQICWSNKQVLAKMADYIVDLKKTNNFNCVNVSPMDGYPLCDCPECNKLDIPEGSKSASLINGLNYMLDRINKTYPDLKIITLAYLDYVKPPKTIIPNKNLIITVCSDSHDWDHPLCTIDETDKFRNDLSEWVKYGIKTQVWTYVTNFDHYLLPNPNLIVASKNNKIIRDLGAKGVFMQGNYETNSVCASGRMKAWVWSKLLWNPDLDPETLMKDFIYGYYGECAEPIYEYETSLLNIWKKGHRKPHNIRDTGTKDPFELTNGIRWAPTDSLYTDQWTEKSMKLMDKALSLAQDENMRERVESERISLVYLTLCRNIGYRTDSGWHKTLKENISDKEKEYYLSLIKEFEDLFTEIDCKTIQELSPFGDNLNLTLDKWKESLTFDFSKLKAIPIESKGWKFILDKNNEGSEKGFYNVGYDTNTWEDFEIGKPWGALGVDNWTGAAWYKKKFDVKGDLLNNTSVYFYCRGIDEECIIYVNGKKVFEQTIASTGLPSNILWNKPIKFSIKEFLNPGENDLTVYVANPGGYNGGIYENIYFVASKEDLSEVNINVFEML
ncbi:MAG: DUF4838 domain-containing protein [Armatimonadetes bacterium]|nr:DUF4838 domain-containing protein [Candidatus Hippobium faecium]